MVDKITGLIMDICFIIFTWVMIYYMIDVDERLTKLELNQIIHVNK